MSSKFYETAKKLDSVLEESGMKLNECGGRVYLVNNKGVKVQLKSLFRLIELEEKIQRRG